MSHLRCVLVSCSCTARFLNHLVHSTSPTPYQSTSLDITGGGTADCHPQANFRNSRQPIGPPGFRGPACRAWWWARGGGRQGGQEGQEGKGGKEEGKSRFMRACLTRESRFVMANSIVSSAPFPGMDPAQDSWNSASSRNGARWEWIWRSVVQTGGNSHVRREGEGERSGRVRRTVKGQRQGGME
jgi:hypothetical protein